MHKFLDHDQHPAKGAHLSILPLPYEGTVSYIRGTANGPEAILKASHQLEDLEEDILWEPTKRLAIHSCDPVIPAEGELPESYLKKIEEALAKLDPETLVLGIGGEHSVTLPLVNHCLSEGDTMVVIDAHPDLRDSYEGSKNSHACISRRVLESGIRVVQIGLGCISMEEAEFLLTDPPVELFFSRDLYPETGFAVLLETLHALEGNVYLSIDCDGLSTSYMNGVGTPIPGGLEWHQLMAVIHTLLGNPEVTVKGMDVVELMPIAGQITSEFAAAKIIQKLISHRFAARNESVKNSH